MSELSYLNINTVADENRQHIPLDVTGLTVSFAQKYDIRQLGFTLDGAEPEVSRSKSPEPRGDNQSNHLPTIDDTGMVTGKQTTEDYEPELEPTPRTLSIQLERVRDLRREKQQMVHIHRKDRKSKMQRHHHTNRKLSKPKTPRTPSISRQGTRGSDLKRKLEKGKAKVTFNIPDTPINGISRQSNYIDGEVYIELPLIEDSKLHNGDRNGKLFDSRPTSPGLTVASPDKSSIMRRYFMDVARRDGDSQLFEQLRIAPDNNFKPGSASAVHDVTAARRRIDGTSGGGGGTAPPTVGETIASSPAVPGGQYSPVHRRPVNQRLNARHVSRSKSFHSGSNTAATTGDKFDETSRIKDLDKLNRLKEHYLKQREGGIPGKSEQKQSETHGNKSKGSSSGSVLEKMRTGSDDIEGVGMRATTTIRGSLTRVMQCVCAHLLALFVVV